MGCSIQHDRFVEHDLDLGRLEPKRKEGLAPPFIFPNSVLAGLGVGPDMHVLGHNSAAGSKSDGRDRNEWKKA